MIMIENNEKEMIVIDILMIMHGNTEISTTVAMSQNAGTPWLDLGLLVPQEHGIDPTS